MTGPSYDDGYRDIAFQFLIGVYIDLIAFSLYTAFDWLLLLKGVITFKLLLLLLLMMIDDDD